MAVNNRVINDNLFIGGNLYLYAEIKKGVQYKNHSEIRNV